MECSRDWGEVGPPEGAARQRGSRAPGGLAARRIREANRMTERSAGGTGREPKNPGQGRHDRSGAVPAADRPTRRMPGRAVNGMPRWCPNMLLLKVYKDMCIHINASGETGGGDGGQAAGHDSGGSSQPRRHPVEGSGNTTGTRPANREKRVKSAVRNTDENP